MAGDGELNAHKRQPGDIPVVDKLLAAGAVLRAQTKGHRSTVSFRWTWSPAFGRHPESLESADHLGKRNVIMEHLWDEGDDDRRPALAADLVRRQVSVIVTGGSGRAPTAPPPRRRGLREGRHAGHEGISTANAAAKGLKNRIFSPGQGRRGSLRYGPTRGGSSVPQCVPIEDAWSFQPPWSGFDKAMDQTVGIYQRCPRTQRAVA
jgi:hypothetical protein